MISLVQRVPGDDDYCVPAEPPSALIDAGAHLPSCRDSGLMACAESRYRRL